METVKILLAIPASLYISIVALIASIAVLLKYAKAGEENSSPDVDTSAALPSSHDVLADVSLAGVIAFSLLCVYFSLSVISDWRNSRGVFFPEDKITTDGMPVMISNDIPPAPPPLK